MIPIENIYIKPANNESKSETHMQIDKNTLVFIKNFDNVQKAGYTFILEKFDGDQLVEKLMADRIAWDSVKSKWSIENYTVRTIKGLKETMTSGAKKDTTLDKRPVDFVVYDNIYSAMATSELNDRIEKEKIRGTGVMQLLQLELYKRYVNPLAAFVLTLMGVSLSSRKVRGGIGLPLGI